MFSRIMFIKRSRNNYKWTYFTVTVLYVITYRLKYFHRSSALPNWEPIRSLEVGQIDL